MLRVAVPFGYDYKTSTIAAEIPLEPGVDELFRVVPGFHQYLANIGTSDDENRMSIFKDLIVSLGPQLSRRVTHQLPIFINFASRAR